MSRRQKRENNGDYMYSISTWVLGGVAIALIIAFAVGYILSNNQTRQAKKITGNTTRIAETNTIDMVSETTNSQEVSSSLGKSVNELESANNVDTETTNSTNTTKMAVNTSEIEKKQETNKNNIDKNNTETNSINEKADEKDSEIANTQSEADIKETKKDPSFVQPVEGEKIKDYSKDNLIYSSTLEEWTTHTGIDYSAEKTDIVKAAADGTIKSIKNDPRYGLTVVIEHENGFESVYSSLLTAEFVTIGEEVKQGQTIATVGNTATFEVADETHLHFEIKKDGENVDPNIYIK